jgi:hypothetical protein
MTKCCPFLAQQTKRLSIPVAGRCRFKIVLLACILTFFPELSTTSKLSIPGGYREHDREALDLKAAA